jgi:GNAT superfamily N-acetyltransferase
MSGVPIEVLEQRHGQYVLSTDPARVDVAAVHSFLSESSYWARGRPFDVQSAAIANSPLVVGAYDISGGHDSAGHDTGDDGGGQVGFARMVTDLATFAWLCDVYVLDGHRGGGLGAAMVRLIVEHPAVRSVRLQILATADAHGLYARFGYLPLSEPARWMARRPDDR